MADTNNTKKEYREFRTLLRKGIGCRTQKEFAVAAGISPAYLNKMLKNDMIPTFLFFKSSVIINMYFLM